MWGVEGVGGGGGGAAVGGAEEGEDKFGGVGEEEHDDIALVDSEVVEAGGDFAGGELDVGVGEDVAGGAINDAGAVCKLVDVLEAVGVEGDVIGDVDVGEL